MSKHNEFHVCHICGMDGPFHNKQIHRIHNLEVEVNELKKQVSVTYARLMSLIHVDNALVDATKK